MPNRVQAVFPAFKQKVSAHYIAVGVSADRQLFLSSTPIAFELLGSKHYYYVLYKQ